MRIAKLVTDDGRSQRHRLLIVDLTKQFATPLQVFRVGKIVFGIHAFGSRKDAIRTDVDKTRAGKLA